MMKGILTVSKEVVVDLVRLASGAPLLLSDGIKYSHYPSVIQESLSWKLILMELP